MFFLCTSMLLAPSAHAYKVDVHIWIANQVLRDARDGSINLDFGDRSQKIRISANYRRALRRFPRLFLLGSLGPDAFPDVTTGQLVIHPSIRGGWGTAEWLRHLMGNGDLSDAETAFVLGYLTHAASDIFAHTFVNRYAGDLFELKNHRWAAIRHIYLESFISKHLPPMRDPVTNRIVSPVASVGTKDKLNIPIKLLRKKIFFNKSAIRELKKSSGAAHLTSAYELYSALDEVLSEDGLLFDLEALGLKLVLEAVSGVPIGKEIAEKLQSLNNQVTGELNGFAGDANQFLQDLNSRILDIEGLRNEISEKGLKASIDIAFKLASLQAKVLREGIRLAELEQDLIAIPEKVSKRICRGFAKVIFGPSICILWKTYREINPYWLIKKHAIKGAKGLLSDFDKRKDELNEDFKDAVSAGFDVMEAELELRRNLTNQFIEFAGDKPFSSPFRKPFEIWKENIPIVLDEFAKANAQAILNTIDDNNPSITEPMQQWLICYGPGLGPVPTKATAGVCIAWDGINKIKQEIDEFEEQLADLTPITKAVFRAKQKLVGAIEKLKERIFDESLQAGLKQFDRIAGAETTYIYKGLAKPVGVADLNRVMSQDKDGQGLLQIGDAAQRVIAEMHIRQGKFDPTRFSTVYNSIVLSKLALLNQRGLKDLAFGAGIEASVFGPRLFSGTEPFAKNVLFGFAKNIDGNHQWHDLAPPHPRREGFERDDYKNRIGNVQNRYGYSDQKCIRSLGMRLWDDPKAKKTLFEKLFKGKMTAGIDQPKSLSNKFKTVLSPNYPNLFGDGDWAKDSIVNVAGKSKQSFEFSLERKYVDTQNIDVKLNGSHIARLDFSLGKEISDQYVVEITSTPILLTASSIDSSGQQIGSTSWVLGCRGEVNEESSLASSIRIVDTGDNLWNISKALTGVGNRYSEIVSLNKDKIIDPDLIYPAQILRLPSGPKLFLSPN